MIDPSTLKIIEIFDQTSIGKIYYYLQKASNEKQKYPNIVQWISQHTIQIKNMSLFNQKIYPTPFATFKFSIFLPYQFSLIENNCMFHPTLASNSTKQQWIQIWMNVMTKEFFEGNSDLTNLFLLLQLSKIQEKVKTTEPPSPVCWLSCGKEIEFIDKKNFLSFLKTRTQRHFSRKIYGFDAMSKCTMGHDFLTKDSPLEAWVAVYARSKLIQSQRQFSRITNQGDLKYLKNKVRQLKKNKVKSEEICQVQQEINKRRQNLKEEKMREKQFDPLNLQEVTISKDKNKSIPQQRVQVSQFNFQFPQFLKIKDQDQFCPEGQQIEQKMDKPAPFNEHKPNIKIKPSVSFSNNLKEMQNSPQSTNHDYNILKQLTIESLQSLQDHIVKVGSRCIQLYKVLLPIYKYSSQFVTAVFKFDYDYKAQTQNQNKIQQEYPQEQDHEEEEVWLPFD